MNLMTPETVNRCQTKTPAILRNPKRPEGSLLSFCSTPNIRRPQAPILPDEKSMRTQ